MTVAGIVQWALSKRFKVDVCCNYGNHKPQSACVRKLSSKAILWDFNTYTDHVLSAHRPDIVMIDKNKNTVTIIDISVPADSNISSKESEKIYK